MTQEEKDRLARTRSKEYQYWLKTGKRHPNMIANQNAESSKSKSKLKADTRHVNSTAGSSSKPPVSSSKQLSGKESLSSSSRRPPNEQQSASSRINAVSASSSSTKTAASQKTPSCSVTKSSHSSSSSRRKDTHADQVREKPKLGAVRPHSSSRPATSSVPASSRRTSYDETNNNVLDCGPGSSAHGLSTWDKIYNKNRRKRQKPGTVYSPWPWWATVKVTVRVMLSTWHFGVQCNSVYTKMQKQYRVEEFIKIIYNIRFWSWIT